MTSFLARPRTDKTIQWAHNDQLQTCTVQMQGWRTYMEDAKYLNLYSQPSILAIFDGHGGSLVSRTLSRIFPEIFFSKLKLQSTIEKALYQTFVSLDGTVQQLMAEKNYDCSLVGSTANVVLLTSTHLYCANVGDSRAVLSKNGQAVCLSHDHKPDNSQQKARIQAAGGFVKSCRVDGKLNMSRAIGDYYLKRHHQLQCDKQKVISIPEIVVHELTGEEDFLLMGCDGIWEKYDEDSQGLIDLINSMRRKKEMKEVLGGLVDELLADELMQVGCDNMTAILTYFKR